MADILFVDFCNVLEQISMTRNADEKTEYLKGFTAQINNQNDRELILRLLLPRSDKEKGTYHLQEFSITKVIINILGLDKNGRDAKLLRNYKSSGNVKINNYSESACIVLKKYFCHKPSLTITNVDKYLAKIAESAKTGVRDQEAVINKLFSSTSLLEQKWIIRLILKDLKLGMRNSVILEKVIGKKQSRSLVLFEAIEPMLSMRCDDREFNRIADKVYYIETKYDGDRFQLHYEEGAFKYFSRRGFDYTEALGKDYCKGFSNQLQGCFSTNIRSVILDGEMVAWDKRNKCLMPKGANVDVKTLKADNEKYGRCFCVFDILLLNGEVLTKKPLKIRKEILNNSVKSIDGVIVLSKYSSSSSKNDIITALNSAIDQNEEGVVFKDVNSMYAPGCRKGWWKVKPDFFKNIVTDLDVVVIGGYYTKGKITSFLVALVDKSEKLIHCLSFAKITSGLSQQNLEMIERKLQKFWIKRDGTLHERYGIYWGKEAPDVWIKPENSCCFVVAGAELQKSYDYKTRYTLRFPRVLKIRFDKPYQDCLSIAELNRMTRGSPMIVKLNKRHLSIDDLSTYPVKKQKFLNNNLSSVKCVGNLFKGHEIFVLSGQGDWPKSRLETKIVENSGKVVQTETKNLLCIIAGDDHGLIPIYKGNKDIVKIEWATNILESGVFTLYTPRQMIYTSQSTKRRFLKYYNKFGDSYTEEVTVDSLRHLIEAVFTNNKNNYINLTSQEMSELAEETCCNQLPFVGHCAYFDKYEIVNDVTSKRLFSDFLEEMEFLYNGGTISNTINEDCTVVLSNTGCSKRLSKLKTYLKTWKIEAVIFKSIYDIFKL